MTTYIKDGQVLIGNSLKNADILIKDGVISKIGQIPDTVKADKIINAKGLTVLPAFLDMHCHLREPGQEYKEDIESGTRSAARGGFYAVCCMPNTKPVIDNNVVVEYIKSKAQKAGSVKVYPIGAITKGQKGTELSEMRLMSEAGAVAFSDDGKTVQSAQIMRLALEYSKDANLLLISHCEDDSLTDGGAVNEGYNATVSGLKGNTRASEEVIIARDMILANTFDARIHIAHVSTKLGVEMIRQAKKLGVKVTAETCPHYFSFTDDLVLSYDTSTKVNPPLREQSDVDAVIKGLCDGTIDCIATDHAPHHIDDKNVEYEIAASGSVGFESAFSAAYTNLVKTNKITLAKLAELMSFKPSDILGLSKAEIVKGNNANLAIVDLNEEYVFDVSKTAGKARNSIFEGQKLQGRVKYTLVDGIVRP